MCIRDSLGYGITERVLTLQSNGEDPVPEAFKPLAFPGDSLQEIRNRFRDDDPSLQVDVSALEAAEAASRPAQPAAKPAIKKTPKPAVALETPEAPVWSDSQTIAPGLEKDDGLTPSSAQEPALELDDSNADSLVLPEESIKVLPPGAEAFFEAIEPVTPPQP